MTERAFVNARPHIQIGGEERADIADALNAMTVNRVLHGSSHAEIQLRNWGTPEDGSEPHFIFDDIALGAELEILMGEDNPEQIFQGEITAIEERYGDGAPSLVLLAQDKLHRMARSRHSRSFEDQSPDDVLNSIAGEAGLQVDVQISNITASWHQINESDLAFLLRLGRQFDIGVRQVGNQLRAKPEESDAEPIVLSPQDSVLKLRLIADLNHQASETTVNGYNLADDVEVSFTSGGLEPAPSGDSAKSLLNELDWTSSELVPQPFARSSAEAEAFAKAHMKRRAKRFISGEILCVGEHLLTAGREIELQGVSERLQGIYQVVHCVHRFDNTKGYESLIKVNKGSWQP